MKLPIFLILLIFFGFDLEGQRPSYEDMVYQLDSLIDIGIDSQAFPGAQILVRYQDSVIFHRSWGHHTYDSIKQVLTTDIYDLASITKVSTAIPVLMKWYGDGKIDLDRPLKEYFKSLKRSNKKNLTLRQVLSHQGGLIPYIVFWQKGVKKNGRFKKRVFRDTPSKKFAVKITDSLYMNRNFFKKMKRAIRRSKVAKKKTTGIPDYYSC